MLEFYPMTDLMPFFDRLPTPFNFALLVVIVVLGAGMVSSVFKQIRKFACHRNELEFKREMIDRGLSVEEVERLLTAQSSQGADHGAGIDKLERILAATSVFPCPSKKAK